ncbi:hypothetical protein M404DRAFT_1001127 [Pisolithus tinctorius Marx 270]|uniref:Uncharacterized protein n=1 Tax=Pisolithus tinctorius Marx 270 TaxID=870435 RepID=A0A0C3NS12_PISTI|nr:hypothetical protein M404DRAFT_1006982 [Pisolithus tinctorius Marx 270]KIO03645.1 hypothetical protein M404DRAFT_1001127 [Pisolithus tinctorius Marx 270]
MGQYGITSIFVIKFLQDFTFGKSMQGSIFQQGIAQTLLGVQSRRVFFQVVSFECGTKGTRKTDGGCRSQVLRRDTGVLRGNLYIRDTRGTGIFDWYILFVRYSVYESLSRT